MGLKPDENGSIYIMCGNYMADTNNIACAVSCVYNNLELRKYCDKGLLIFEWTDVLTIGIDKLERIKSKIEYDKYDNN